MEFGSREPEEQDSDNEIGGWRKLARAIILQALRDMGGVKISGLSSGPERDSVVRFVNGKDFPGMCQLAGWEPEWLWDVFKSIDRLPESVKIKVTNETIALMNALPYPQGTT